jgi:uncharacterized membrane protein YkvI
MGMLFAPVVVAALIAIGAVSVYVGRRVASRTYNQPMRMALFSVGSIVTGALIVACLFALAVGVVLLAGSS